MNKIWLWGSSHLAAALIGAGMASAYCLYHWTHAVQGALLNNDLAVSAHYGALAETSREGGSEAEYDRALRAYVKVLDTLLAREPRSDVYPTLAFDKAVTLARLGLVNEKRGNAAQSEEHFKNAVAACQASGRSDCTLENLRRWGALPASAGAAAGATK